MLTEEQIIQIKQQIIEQIKSTFPDDKKKDSIEKINLMVPEELENFLKENQILREKGQTPQTECVFCSIINKQIPSYIVDENKDSIAILEINPISKAHCLVIPKKHVSSNEQVPKEAFSLATTVSKKIKTKFKPKETKIYFQNLFGHEIINVLPIYDKENLTSKRKQAEPKELQKLQKDLEKKEIIEKPKKKHTKSKIKEPKLKIKLPKRIP